MSKNDFDIDFDFEEEYGFDPKAFLGTEEYDENVDLNEFSDEELGIDLTGAEETPETEEPVQEEDELPFDPLAGFPRESFAAGDPPHFEEAPAEEEEVCGQEEYQEEDPQEMEEASDYQEEEPQPRKKTKKVQKEKVRKEHHTPKFIEKFYDLYFAPLTNKSMLEEPQDPNNPRRRRKKSQAQIFKEVYLPPILVCLCVVLVLSFVMGSVSNLIAQYHADEATKDAQVQESSNAAAVEELEYNRIMKEAEALAMEYDYQGAIDTLNSFGNTADYPDVATKSAEYATIKSQLVEHNDLSIVPNLSFHVLINDMERAKKDTEYGGLYNKNFVTTGEFEKILNAVYNNGYVLVNLDDFIQSSVGTDGKEMYFPVPVLLPEGKKPIMLTETLVSYPHYMISGTKGGDADANGDGFASKLVVKNGEILAEYVDANGATLTGDYDFVPILEKFIREHPDFVYQGARATIAVTGEEGVFGYRTNTSYTATRGQSFYDGEVVKAKEVAQALRDKGYRIACFTYGNISYKRASANQIQDDLTNWTSQIVNPVLGPVDTMIFAQMSNISDYTGTVFQMLYTSGFRYFISNGDQPWAEVAGTYVRQNRLMVTGNTMAWHKKQFEGIFDPNSVLDAQVRGNVPNE